MSQPPARSFASTLSSLLSQPSDVSRSIKRSSSLLQSATNSTPFSSSSTPTPAAASDDEAVAGLSVSSRVRKQRKIELRLLYEKDHVIQPEFADRERALLRVATKGVVTLFNAVKKAQKQAREEENQENDKQTGENKFIEQLKKESVKNETSSRVKSEPSQPSEAPGWSVLKENFLPAGKLTDWDIESESGEEE
jgi:hypothetical protein